MGKKSSEKKAKHHKKKRSSSSSSSASSLSSIDRETKKKLKKKIKKLKKKEKEKKKKLKRLLKNKLKEEVLSNKKEVEKNTADAPSTSCDIDVALMTKSKSLAPMTKEEWEKQQNTFKRVFDEETNRMRLVRGTGEIVEECVSRERHLAINKQATRGDGEFFQKKLLQQMK